jgi:hypothetical protein
MPFTTFPIPTQLAAANLIPSSPTGIVTATDVQSAIAQLEAAIPSPGPGTDPLFLVEGLSLQVINPVAAHVNTGTTNRIADGIKMITDCSQVDPAFSNQSASHIWVQALDGQATQGGLTSAKQTFLGHVTYMEIFGSGQKFCTWNQMYAYGMSDSAIHSGEVLSFAGGPVSGDEGQAFQLINNLTQQASLSRATISSVPAASTVNTTTTQAITASRSAQTVTVASTAGVAVNDWVIIEQHLPNTGSPNLEAVKITAFSPGASITGIFRYNHNNGVTVTPALRLQLSQVANVGAAFGQDRVIVNLSGASYSTGTVSSISGAAFTGTGTGWTTGMVGGFALNIGAVALDADDFSGGNFTGAGNACKSWYQIKLLTSTTSLAVWSFSVAGDLGYNGTGPGAGAYIIRPCAKLLHLVNDGAGTLTGEIICEQSTSTWTAGDTVECAICPYPDVTGFDDRVAVYTAGGTLRGYKVINNSGARKFEAGISIRSFPTNINAGLGADTEAFGSCYFTDALCDYSARYTNAQTAAILLTCDFLAGGGDDQGKVAWGSNCYIAPDSTNNLGLTFHTMLAAVTPRGDLDFIASSTGVNTDSNRIEMLWHGYISLPVSNTFPSYVLIDNVTHATDYERTFWRWTSNVMQFGTEKGAAGTLRDWALMKGTDTFLTSATTTVGSLPAAGVKGRKHFVTDASAVTFQSIAAGGGANNVPVFDDGTNWRIG